MRNPRVVTVTPNSDYTLVLTFTNGETRVFDVKPYLDKGFFRELQDMARFMSVRSVLGSVQWSGGQDFCPDTLYLDSVSIEDLEPESRTERMITVTHE
ncbi:MAG: DUF2442 domain-containing protein [Anaerolineae bacterium]|nr:DUF2442 domain-containing protein [Anaerolineae bacterium]